MNIDNLVEDRAEEVTLQQAEKRFQDAMVLVGWAEEELRARVIAGDLPDASDVKSMCKELGEAWRALQRERERVAEFRRKRGELVGGDLDLDAARAAVCEQLGRIAASLETG